jgi:hypothetical protein
MLESDHFFYYNIQQSRVVCKLEVFCFSVTNSVFWRGKMPNSPGKNKLERNFTTLCHSF